MNRKEHWERIYAEKAPEKLSWFQDRPTMNLKMLDLAGATPESSVIDIGGGASRLADCLLSQGYEHLTVLDISRAALAHSQKRIGSAAEHVRWIVADVLEVALPERYDIWHDRAVFHFLTDLGDRRRYSEQLFDALKPSGHAIITTFAEDGPERCSGLPCVRYSPQALEAELGPTRFRLLTSMQEAHVTPQGVEQRFQYSLLQKGPSGYQRPR